ncbi:hypothetical protein FOZ62_008297, partial [Perkinsus olseni]
STPNRLLLLPSTVVMMCPKMVPLECLSCLISLEMHPVTAVTIYRSAPYGTDRTPLVYCSVNWLPWLRRNSLPI